MTDGHNLAMALRTAYLAMHRQANASVAAAGITVDQFVVLWALADTHSATQQELARRTASDPNTLRAMLLLLERKGLVHRPRCATDRRARAVELTPAGEQLFADACAMSDPFRERLVGALGADDAATLVRLLGRVASAMAEPTPEPEQP